MGKMRAYPGSHRPPAHRKGPASSPGTGPRCPECGLPVLPTPPAAVSWPGPAPGVSTLPAGGLGLSVPGPSGLQPELRVSWAPEVQVGAPPPPRSPQPGGFSGPRSCSAALCALRLWPPREGSSRAPGGPCVPSHPDTRGFSPPGPTGLGLFGALWGHCGVFPLGCCHPVIWERWPVSCPQAWPASSLLSGCS